MTDSRYEYLKEQLGEEKANMYRYMIHHGDLKPWLEMRRKEKQCENQK